MAIGVDIAEAVIDKNLVFGLSSRSPIFVIDGRLYYCSLEPSSTESCSNTFKWKDTILNVKEGPLIEVLERLSDKQLKGDYERYQQELIAAELHGFDSENRYREFSQDYERLVRFAVNEIFPYLRKDATKALDGLLETHTPEVKNKQGATQNTANDAYGSEIEEYIQNRIPEFEGQEKRITAPKRNKLDSILLDQNLSKSSRDDSLLLKLMDGYNFAIGNGTVYCLANVRRGEDLTINGVRYVLMPTHVLAGLQSDFASEVIKRISVEALREKLKDSQEFQRLKAARSDIDLLCKRDSYHEQDFGFLRNSDRLIVYVDVPEHVLENPYTQDLYRFNSHRVGIQLSMLEERRTPVIDTNPHSPDRAIGPFYSGYDGHNPSLCMGHYNTSYFNTMRMGKAIAKYLVDARNVVLRGYIVNCNPRRNLNKENFGQRRISREEVNRLGLPITNKGYQTGRCER